MNSGHYVRDLLCLVADKNQEQALRGVFSRPEALGIRVFSFDIFVHPESDPGCCQQSPDFLRPLNARYRFALVLFDFEGCGDETADAAALERRIERLLMRNGWGDRGRVVVIEPELEAWVWSSSPEVDRALGWSGRLPDLRTWLLSREFMLARDLKPDRPKEAVEAALREVRKPRSSAIYGALARTA
jgi:hypothetical protein